MLFQNKTARHREKTRGDVGSALMRAARTLSKLPWHVGQTSEQSQQDVIPAQPLAEPVNGSLCSSYFRRRYRHGTTASLKSEAAASQNHIQMKPPSPLFHQMLAHSNCSAGKKITCEVLGQKEGRPFLIRQRCKRLLGDELNFIN